eukprot:jgi/Hompol1/226/HPOL_000681-RA
MLSQTSPEPSSIEFVELRAHSDRVHSVGWSCDGRKVASASTDKTAHVWSLDYRSLTQRNSESVTLKGHTAGVDQLAWCPVHAEKLATASADRSVKLWDLRSPRSAVQTIQTKGENINITWNPNGTVVAVGDKVNEIKWNYSGDLLYLTMGDGYVKILDYPSLKPQHSFRAHTSNAYVIDFDPSGKYFATGGADALVAIWEPDTFTCIKTISSLVWPIRAISFSFDGTYIAAGSEDKQVEITNVESGECAHAIKVTSSLNAIAWHPSRYIGAFATDSSAHGHRQPVLSGQQPPCGIQVFSLIKH